MTEYKHEVYYSIHDTYICDTFIIHVSYMIHFKFIIVFQWSSIYHRTRCYVKWLCIGKLFCITNHSKWLKSIMYYFSCICGMGWSWLILTGLGLLKAIQGSWPAHIPLVLQQKYSVLSLQETDTVVGLARCHVTHMLNRTKKSTHWVWNSERYSHIRWRVHHRLWWLSLFLGKVLSVLGPRPILL